MFSSKTPWIVLLLAWMTGATWWHVCKIKQICGEAAPETSGLADGVPAAKTPVPSLLIADGDRFRLALAGDFSFAKSGANANMNTLEGSLNSLTAYLKGSGPSSRNGRALTITGYYATDETSTLR